MARDASFRDYVVLDLLGDVPHLSTQAMFGGWGLYCDGKIFAIIADGELYFKANDAATAHFASDGGVRFAYERQGKTVALNYWRVPEEVLENPERFAAWVTLTLAAA